MAKKRPNKEDIDDAEQRANTHFDEDPHVALEPALLSAEHIEYYIRTTGMIDSFDRDALKSASYEVPMRGQAIYWDDKRVRVTKTITDIDSTLTLLPNSITFVEVEPIFRMPLYIAFRFNLRIHHVHRGLLLGTGPLVDPGFRGKILIPLHNLTATPYDLDLSSALIWIEFTKTSHNRHPPDGNFKKASFPESAWYRAPLVYLQNANGGFPIVSSIPDAVEKSANRAEDAEKSSKAATESLQTIRTFGLFAILTAVGGVAAIVFSCLNIIGSLRSDLTTYQEKASSRLTALETRQSEASEWHAARAKLEGEISDLKAIVAKLREQAPKGEPAPAKSTSEKP